MRNHITFHVNGVEHRITGGAVFATLSNWLRYDVGATGTKIVCEEGDCGACTVLVRRAASEDFQPINSCIQNLGQMDGASIVTVEGLKHATALSAVQDAMVAMQGAQCGYCTPGFVVAMSALFETKDRVSEKDVRDGLTGNLCRCTGYEPIIKAALAVNGATMPKLRDRYPSVPDADGGVLIDDVFCAPASIEEAVRFKAKHLGCTIVQGGTDFGVWVNKRRFVSPAVLSLAHVPGLDTIEERDGAIVVGGKVTLSQLEHFVEHRIPELYAILNIFGAPQIKNAGTLAGNIANGSPIADTLPLLFVAGASLELTGVGGTRTVGIEQFYLGYKKFDLRPDEIVTRVRIPLISDRLKLYKVSRRKDLDISAFTAAIRLRMNGTRIEEARIAYGGVGPVVFRLPKTEAFLTGADATLDRFESAGRIARGEVAPISDVRGSADYRLQLAENIMAKCWWDLFG